MVATLQVVDVGDDRPGVQVTEQGEVKTFTPEEVSAMILVKMKQVAEDYLGKDVKKAVITVSRSFV